MLKTREHRNSGQHLAAGDISGRKQQYKAGSRACVYTRFRRGPTANMGIDPPPLSEHAGGPLTNTNS